MHIMLKFTFKLTANFGPPPPPHNGHIVPYNSTLEGAEVTYVCWNVYQEENTSQCTDIYTTAVCNEEGIWEPKFDDMCSIFSGTIICICSQDGSQAYNIITTCMLKEPAWG